MTDSTKKLIATALATGGIVSGAFATANNLSCDHTMVIADEKYCVEDEVYREIQSNLQPNAGFGGVRFHGDSTQNGPKELVVPSCLKDQRIFFRNEMACICEGVPEQTEEGLICREPKG